VSDAGASLEPALLLTRRAALAAALMAGAAWTGNAFVPRRRMADRRGGFKLAEAVPERFAGWQQDPNAVGVVANPQTEALLQRLYTETLERTYVRGPGERIMLSIAYGADQTDNSVQLHYPEVCYPAQGFEVLSSRRGQIVAAQGVIPVRRLETVFANQRFEPVTYWTVVGDRLSLGGVDRRLAEIRHGLRGEVVDGMLVRVSSINRRSDQAFELQELFVKDLLTNLSSQARQRLAALP
jgi:EpsI family protein